MIEWLDTEAAAPKLGITARQLRKLRQQGVFKFGKHYRKKNPNAARPTYVWHVEKCLKIVES